MKTKRGLTLIAIILSTILLSVGCKKKTATANRASEIKSDPQTRPLQAVDLVGYNGTSLRKSVDRIKQANERHNQELEKTLETKPDQ